jgi:hypothetical protein
MDVISGSDFLVKPLARRFFHQQRQNVMQATSMTTTTTTMGTTIATVLLLLADRCDGSGLGVSVSVGTADIAARTNARAKTIPVMRVRSGFEDVVAGINVVDGIV